MSRPDEGMIHAWLDGELSAEEAARVQRLTETDAEWKAAVAEARGLIAASSRIVGALDAVPGGVVPTGTRAAPWAGMGGAAARGFRVRPWMGIAAGLVLVVGTAYMIRDTTEQVFGVSTSVPRAAESEVRAVTESAGREASNVRDAARDATPAPPLVAALSKAPAVASAPSSAGAAGQGVAGSGAAPIPLVAPPSAAPAVAVPAARQELSDEMRRAAERTRAAGERSVGAARAPAVAGRLDRQALSSVVAKAESDALTLEGCWLVTAPDSLAGLLRDPPIERAAGDTVVLRIAGKSALTVVRDGEVLRGALTARRAECPPR